MSLPNEETWRDVPGYEGWYEVSDQGRVRSLPRRGVRGRLLKGYTEKGYRSVKLYRDNSAVAWRVNRLVATVFHRPPVPEEVCRHLNGDSLDNRAINLAWGTTAENAQDTVSHGRHHSASKTHCKHGHPLTEGNIRRSIRPDGAVWRYCIACSRARRAHEVTGAQRINCPECGREIRRSVLARHNRRAHAVASDPPRVIHTSGSVP